MKVFALIALSKELIHVLGDDGLRNLSRELVEAVSVGSDAALMSVLASVNAFEGNSTASFDAMLSGIEELLRNVEPSNSSRPYIIVPSRIAKGLAIGATGAGVVSMGIAGGELAGIPVLVTFGQSDTTITIVDARALAGAADEVEIRLSNQATLEMNTAPSHTSDDPTGANLISMFQTNSRAVLVERSLAVKLIRPNAAASLVNVQWGLVGESPAGF